MEIMEKSIYGLCKLGFNADKYALQLEFLSKLCWKQTIWNFYKICGRVGYRDEFLYGFR